MTAKNDITGDLIQSKSSSKAYEDNYDLIFRKKKSATTRCRTCDKVVAEVKDCAWTSCPVLWDESRVDVVGQNGNEGLHYEEENGS